MNTALSILAIPLLGIQILFVGLKEQTSKKSDLAITKIYAPKFNKRIQGSEIRIQIKNLSNTPSKPCTLKVWDLDISYEDAQKITKDHYILNLVKENNNKATTYNLDADGHVKDLLDYDTDWELKDIIPSIGPNQIYERNFHLDEIWVFDSNCEIRVVIDEENINQEENTQNNWLDFFEWG